MSGLPQVPGARKKGVLLFCGDDDFKKLDSYLINDTVCIDGPAQAAFNLARSINEKYKVGVKVVTGERFEGELPADIQAVYSPIQEIVGEGRAEAVKFRDGKAIGVSLVLFIGGEKMADVLIQLGTKGSEAVLNLARAALEKAVKDKGEKQAIGFPETNYYLPLINGLLNIEAKDLGGCLLALKQAEDLNKGIAAKSG